jgi:hypothetical protein
MPIIFCTAKLSKIIGIKNRASFISINNWNAHLFLLEKRKCLVFVHKETFYSFVVFDILKKDLKDFKNLFETELIKQLKTDSIYSTDLHQILLKNTGSIEISTTDDDKSTIGYMNDCITRLTWPYGEFPPTISDSKNYVENNDNQNLIGVRKYRSPIDLLKAHIKN